MTKDSVYFFAEYSTEFAVWNELATSIRSLDSSIRLELIYAKESRISDLNPETFFSPFHAVHEVDHVSHEMGGRWRQGFSPQNVHHSLTKVFPKARKVYTQLNEIDFSENSVAFVYLGVTLNQVLFLKSVKSRPGVQSVLLLRDYTLQAFLTNYIVNPSQSLLLNFYFHFFGTAYVDVFWAKAQEDFRTSTRDYLHRNKPADYVFQSLYPFRSKSLQLGQVVLPLNIKQGIVKPSKQETVMFIGQPHYFLGGFPNQVENRFYERLNTIIDIIRDLHRSHRLIYKSHPGQTKEQLSRLNLDGFEVIKSSTSEALFKEDNSITTAYGFSSISIQTALCYGIKGYYLYRLFYDILEDLPLSVKMNWEQRWDSEYHNEVVLRSMDDWKSGKNDYSISDISTHIKAQTMSLLTKVGIINISNTAFDITKLEELLEERWTKHSGKSTFNYVFFILLFLPKLIFLFFFVPVRNLLKKLRVTI